MPADRHRFRLPAENLQCPVAMNKHFLAWPSRDGEVLIGDRKLTEVAALLSSDAFYAYDRQRIRSRVAELRFSAAGRNRYPLRNQGQPLP